METAVVIMTKLAIPATLPVLYTYWNIILIYKKIKLKYLSVRNVKYNFV